MKTGYDLHFKKVQKAASQGKPADSTRREQKVQSRDAKALAQELRKNMRPRRQKRAPASFPWKLVLTSFIGLLVAAVGTWQVEEVEYFIKHLEISMLGSAHASGAPAKTAEDAAAKKVDPSKNEQPPVAKKEYTEEDLNHFSKLNERKRELDAREEELNRMDQEIQTQKAELEKKLAEIENTRRNISSVLEEKVKGDDQKVENLVQVYSNMKPQQAAKAFEEMDENLAIEILGRMKKKNAAEIMNLVKSEKVKILSEKYTGYKRN